MFLISPAVLCFYFQFHNEKNENIQVIYQTVAQDLTCQEVNLTKAAHGSVSVFSIVKAYQ